MILGQGGSYIAAPQIGPIERSIVYPDSIAFTDKEGHWVHLDVGTIKKLHTALTVEGSPSATPSQGEPQADQLRQVFKW